MTRLKYRQEARGATEGIIAKKDIQKKSKPKPRMDYSFTSVIGIALPTAYAAVLFVSYLVYNVLPGPEFIILCFFIYAMYNKWSRRFVKDWVPLIALFLSYEAMYGLVGGMRGFVHIQEPISADAQIFGIIPTLLLQNLYRAPILDYLGAFFYSLHFIAPTVFAFLLWKFKSQHYWKYTLALAISTYTALMTFLVYPVAPPWYGLNATRILFQVDSNIGLPIYRTIFDYISPNPFAAFPSLHSTYPWLISLYSFKIWKKKAFPVLIFPFFVWFSAVYLGEHYVVDVIGGILYATCAFLLVEKLIPYVRARQLAHLPKISGLKKPQVSA